VDAELYYGFGRKQGTCRLLAVDRSAFSKMVTEHLSSHPNIKTGQEEVSMPSFEIPAILQQGPYI
jgi:folate-dependent tRNA-U54 methylase TrmFO/GidA